ncbi:MAG: type II toxin-antitoxin system VapB family antitoxin [Geminicoccaceae bacterium]
MRTNIDLDDDLLEEARRLSGLRTKKAVVDKALATFIRCAREREALAMFGKLEWVGDLAASREGRTHDEARAPDAAPEPAWS